MEQAAAALALSCCEAGSTARPFRTARPSLGDLQRELGHVEPDQSPTNAGVDLRSGSEEMFTLGSDNVQAVERLREDLADLVVSRTVLKMRVSEDVSRTPRRNGRDLD